MRFTSLLIFIVSLSGCVSDYRPAATSNSNANQTIANAIQVMANATANPEPKVYSPDLAGQLMRIAAEGIADEQIKTNVAAVDKAVTYEHLKKNAEKYAGQPWAFSGKVLEIGEKDGMTVARISLDDWGTKVVLVTGPFETEFVEKNRVYVVGYLAGNHSYTSQANWNITIPALVARAIIKPADAKKYSNTKKKK